MTDSNQDDDHDAKLTEGVPGIPQITTVTIVTAGLTPGDVSNSSAPAAIISFEITILPSFLVAPVFTVNMCSTLVLAVSQIPHRKSCLAPNVITKVGEVILLDTFTVSSWNESRAGD